MELNTIGRSGTRHKYRQLAEMLRGQIRRHELNPGDRLPSFSQLRIQHGVTLSTVERVYSLLENEGLIERRHGSGTYVTEPAQARNGNIGFVGGAINNRRQHPFNAHIIEGVQQAIAREHQHLLYMGTDYALNLEACAKTDGVLICGVEEVALVAHQLPVLLPRVSMLIVAKGMISVVADDYRGAKMATQHLLKRGHCRIACLMEENPSIARRRAAGYRDALQEAGSEVDPRWMRLTDTVRDKVAEQPYLDWARAQMQEWLRSDWQEVSCTAILVQNDVAAIGVMQVLEEEGMRVPEDISIIGFDGTEICDLITPRLTAMQLPLAEIGARAVELLNLQIEGDKEIGQTVMLPMKLREGESVAPPRR